MFDQRSCYGANQDQGQTSSSQGENDTFIERKMKLEVGKYGGE